jgi:hypothetical protein
MRLALALMIGTLLVAAPASAATRYADPNGSPSAQCPAAFPCDWKTAIEGATAGDEVIAKAGTYNLAAGQGASNAVANLTVRGEAPGAVQVATAGTAINLAGGTDSAVRDMEIDATGGIAVYARTIERVEALTQSGPSACRVNRALDSICVNRDGLGIEVDNPSAVLRNVTAIGTTYGIRLAGSGEIFNTIARGTSNRDIDLNNSGATVVLHHSNYVDKGVLDSSSSFDESGGGNVVGEPTFVDAGGGDYHLQPASVGVDRGAPVDGLDVDGDLRTLGPAPDIGGDEASVPPAALISPPTNVAASSASFSGTVNTGGFGAEYWFEYGPEGGARDQTAQRALPARPNVVSVSSDVGGLVSGTSYVVTLHVRTDRGSTSATARFTTLGPPGDSEPPVLGSLSVTNKVFAVGGPFTPVAAAAKKGTTLRFRVSEAGTAVMAVQRARRGRKRGRKCVPPRKARREARKCTRWVTRFPLRRNTEAGLNSVPFSGRVTASGLKRKLGPGKHRFRVVARDAAGNRSDPATVAFRVVRR